MDKEIEELEKKISGAQYNVHYLQNKVYQLTGLNENLREKTNNCSCVPQSVPASSRSVASSFSGSVAGSARSNAGAGPSTGGGSYKAGIYVPEKEKRERWDYVDGKWESKWTTEWEKN